jgi:nucleotide-binding universal stress UspA family protein
MPSATEPYSAALLAVSHLDVDEQVEHEAVAYLQGIAARLNAKGLSVTWHVYHGAPIHTIDRVAKDTANTLVALTTHGRSGIKRLVLGSVADAVICDSGHPVLVVPPRGDK